MRRIVAAMVARNGMRTTRPLADLTLPSSVTGTFRIGLEVWDDRSAKSANADVITLNVYP